MAGRGPEGTPSNPIPLDWENPEGTAANPIPLDWADQEEVLVVGHFSLPHSGNPPRPFCKYGQVWAKGGKYFLGLTFNGDRQFIYPFEPFATPEAVIASMQRYKSASWATSPTGPEYDGARFGKGRYRQVS